MGKFIELANFYGGKMKRLLCILILLHLITLGFPLTSHATSSPGKLLAKASGLMPGTPLCVYKPGEVLVKFKEGIRKSSADEIKSEAGASVLGKIGPRDKKDIEVLKLKPGVSVEKAVQELSSNHMIEYAEPNFIYKIAHTPTDPDFPKQWGLHNTGQVIGGSVGVADADIDAPDAWDIEKGTSNDVTVAVIDSGIDFSHPDLSSRIWVNSDETAGNGLDDDGNGFVDDRNWYNWAGISQYNCTYWNGSAWVNSYENFGTSITQQMFAQSFTARATPGHKQRLTHVGIALRKIGNPTSPINVVVRTSLTGSDLSSYVIDYSEISSTGITEIYKALSTPLNLDAGLPYYLIFWTSQASASDYYRIYDNWGTEEGTWHTYHEGEAWQWTGSGWTSLYAKDFYFRTNPYFYPHDNNAHGTHCAGIVAASENAQGVVGVAPGLKVRVMPLKVTDSSGGAYASHIIDAIYYAADNGADVINMSLQSESHSSLVQNAITYAYGKGAAIFASAGNTSDSTLMYPAGYSNVIGVGATTNRDERAVFSTYNSSVDISAPGKDIYSAMPTYSASLNALGYTQNYSFMDGTSMASPMAAGSAALLLSEKPSLTPLKVQQTLESTAKDLGASGRDDYFGYGRINAYAALKKITALPKPVISSLSPSSGSAGANVTIYGSGFGSTRGSSYVSFGTKRVSSYLSWANNRLKVKVPTGVSGKVAVTVTTAGGKSNSKSFTVVQKNPLSTWYLAEGSTDWGFETYISIANPNSTEVTIRMTYQTKSGPVVKPDFRMAPMSQATIFPWEDLGEEDFSTKVECLEGKTIAVDRTMFWGLEEDIGDAHSSIGVTSPAKTWYLPEGSTAWGFECWLLIQNPNSSTASCDITYMIENEGPSSVKVSVPANSRATFNMAEHIGAKDASIKVSSNLPVIPERAMYRNNRKSGHDSVGTTSPSLNYYLAEGTTAWGFTTYVLVQNPNSEPTSVVLTYMTNEGPITHPESPILMPPNSRKTIRVNDYLPPRDFSTKVTGDRPIIAERAMYWGEGTIFGEKCHDSIGLSAAHKTFYLPDGEAGMHPEAGLMGEVQTWTLVQNPNDQEVAVEVTYLPEDGSGEKSITDTVPANSRKTYFMADVIQDGRASVMVSSKTAGKKIMVERAMYALIQGYGMFMGTATIGGYSD